MQVKGCDDCPLCQQRQRAEDGWSCDWPDGDETLTRPLPCEKRPTLGLLPPAVAPDWCPLRAAPLTIALEAQVQHAQEWPVTVCGTCESCYKPWVGRFASPGTVQGICGCGAGWCVTLAEQDDRVTAMGIHLKYAMGPITP